MDKEDRNVGDCAEMTIVKDNVEVLHRDVFCDPESGCLFIASAYGCVSERIDDIRRLTASKRDALQKMTARETRKPPIQIVSPEKLQRNISTLSVAKLSPAKENEHDFLKKVLFCVKI
uniref:Uncharacterized protein n=1 Tax=Syphacia muris TaxID=451379 RepID=A0A0N5ADL5_9BILA